MTAKGGKSRSEESLKRERRAKRARESADVGDRDTAVDLLVLCEACGVRRAVRTCEACWRLSCTPCGFDGMSFWACDWINGEAYDQ